MSENIEKEKESQRIEKVMWNILLNKFVWISLSWFFSKSNKDNKVNITSEHWWHFFIFCSGRSSIWERDRINASPMWFIQSESSKVLKRHKSGDVILWYFIKYVYHFIVQDMIHAKYWLSVWNLRRHPFAIFLNAQLIFNRWFHKKVWKWKVLYM